MEDLIFERSDINDIKVYLLLKYWKDRPRKYEKRFNKLSALYSDILSDWEEFQICMRLKGLTKIPHNTEDQYAPVSKGFVLFETNKEGIKDIKIDAFPSYIDQIKDMKNAKLKANIAIVISIVAVFNDIIFNVIGIVKEWLTQLLY